eukprot:9746501-Lingulodinium_polyedra.AAC.1
MSRNDAVESTFRARSGSPIARLRDPRARRFSVRVTSAHACVLRAVAIAKHRCGRVVAQHS